MTACSSQRVRSKAAQVSPFTIVFVRRGDPLRRNMSIRINPLSVAKGHAHTCELCSQPATILCSTCRVTYYCSASHQQTDRLSIHTKICSLLGALRSLRPTLGSEDERNKRQLTITLSHHALIDLTRAEAVKHLTNNNHLLAIPAALQSLRFAVQVYGKSRLELVPSYLLLAEGNLGLGRLKAAEEYLLYAHWAVVQSGERCAEAMQAELHRQFGLLYVKQGKLHEAIKSYAHDIYHSSLEYGPEHIETSVGIFHMGSTFLLSHRAGHTVGAASSGGSVVDCGQQQEVSSALDSALAFYDKYIDIWYKFLINLRSSSPATTASSPPATANSASLLPSSSIHDYLTTPQLHTHLAHLTTILTTRSTLLSPSHIATAEAAYTLGMLKESGGLDVDAEWLYERAERVYERVLGSDHESVLGVRRAREEMPQGVRLQKTGRMTEWVTDGDEDEKPEAQREEAGKASEKQQHNDETSSETVHVNEKRSAQEEKEQLRIESVPAEEADEESEEDEKRQAETASVAPPSDKIAVDDGSQLAAQLHSQPGPAADESEPARLSSTSADATTEQQASETPQSAATEDEDDKRETQPAEAVKKDAEHLQSDERSDETVETAVMSEQQGGERENEQPRIEQVTAEKDEAEVAQVSEATAEQATDTLQTEATAALESSAVAADTIDAQEPSGTQQPNQAEEVKAQESTAIEDTEKDNEQLCMEPVKNEQTDAAVEQADSATVQESTNAAQEAEAAVTADSPSAQEPSDAQRLNRAEEVKPESTVSGDAKRKSEQLDVQSVTTEQADAAGEEADAGTVQELSNAPQVEAAVAADSTSAQEPDTVRKVEEAEEVKQEVSPVEGQSEEPKEQPHAEHVTLEQADVKLTQADDSTAQESSSPPLVEAAEDAAQGTVAAAETDTQSTIDAPEAERVEEVKSEVSAVKSESEEEKEAEQSVEQEAEGAEAVGAEMPVVKGGSEEEKEATEEAEEDVSSAVIETSDNAASQSHSQVTMSAIEATSADE